MATATKTKAQLEVELKNLQGDLDAALRGKTYAERELTEFKKRIPEVMQEKIDEYGLDLCDEGIEDFCNTLGVQPPIPKISARIEVSVTDIELKAERTSTGWGSSYEFVETSELEKALERAVKDVLTTYDHGGYIEISFEEY